MKKVFFVGIVLLCAITLFSCASLKGSENKGYSFYLHEPYAGDVIVVSDDVTYTTNNDEAGLSYCTGSESLAVGNVKDAELYLNKTIELDPDFPDAYITLGLTLITEDKHKEAIEPLKKALSLDEKNPAAYVMLCKAYKSLNDVQNALSVGLDGIENAQRILKFIILQDAFFMKMENTTKQFLYYLKLQTCITSRM